MKRLLALLALAAAPPGPAALERAREAQAARLAEQRAPLTALLAGLERAALRPPAAALADPGSLDDALRARAVARAMVPLVEARTAAIDRALARSDRLLAEAARARLAADRGAILPDRAAARRLAGLPAPPLRSGVATGHPVYRLPTPGSVLIGVGERVETGVSRGITLATVPGAAVSAPTSGRVAYAGAFGGYHAILILDHGHGWTSLLAGLSGLSVQPGDMVAGGQSLGRMPRRDPRLLIELRRRGRVVDLGVVLAYREG
jgi:murein hydrolase activator